VARFCGGLILVVSTPTRLPSFLRPPSCLSSHFFRSLCRVPGLRLTYYFLLLFLDVTRRLSTEVNNSTEIWIVEMDWTIGRRTEHPIPGLSACNLLERASTHPIGCRTTRLDADDLRADRDRVGVDEEGYQGYHGG
jgi:hypothetical protein